MSTTYFPGIRMVKEKLNFGMVQMLLADKIFKELTGRMDTLEKVVKEVNFEEMEVRVLADKLSTVEGRDELKRIETGNASCGTTLLCGGR